MNTLYTHIHYFSSIRDWNFKRVPGSKCLSPMLLFFFMLPFTVLYKRLTVVNPTIQKINLQHTRTKTTKKKQQQPECVIDGQRHTIHGIESVIVFGFDIKRKRKSKEKCKPMWHGMAWNESEQGSQPNQTKVANGINMMMMVTTVMHRNTKIL